ncbi:Outer membrane protein TolC [bioreactor metagenome]|uniref:Outer membrane protein TolC n=1 Tax=bioreactor metagenome TaxID=1076179 RepID=A0A644XJY0_9ZZZZ
MKRLVIFFLFLAAGAAYGQKVWTLESCIQYARENNLTIRLQALNADLAKLALTREKAAFLPGVQAGATHSYNYGRTVDMYTNEFATDRVRSNNFYIGANITLFNGFNLINSYKKGQLEAEAAVLDAQQTADDISLSIATAYLQVLYSMELVNNARNQLEITNLQVDKNRKMFEAGSVSQGTLLTIEAQAASEESSLISAQNQLEMSYLTLAQMLDLKDLSDFQIAVPDISTIDTASFLLLNPNDVYAFAEKNQPGLLASEYRVQIAERNLSIARAGRYPVLTMNGSLGTGYSGASRRITGYNYNGVDTIGFTSESLTEFVMMPSMSYTYETTPFQDQINDNINKSIGLSLTIPIFSKFNTSIAVRQAKIGIESATINYEQEKLNLQKTIQQAYVDATGAYRKYAATKKQVAALEESFKYMDQRFSVGLATPIDYSDSKNKLATAQSELLQAKYEFIFRTKILDYYLGREIRF